MGGFDVVDGAMLEEGADGVEDDLHENESRLRAAANNLVDAESDAIAARGKVAMLVSGGGVGSSVVEEAKLDSEIADAKVSEARSKVEDLEAKLEGYKVESMSRQASLNTLKRAVEFVDTATAMSRQSSRTWLGAGGRMSRQTSKASLSTVGAGLAPATAAGVDEVAAADLHELKKIRGELATLKLESDNAKAKRRKAEAESRRVDAALQRLMQEHAVLRDSKIGEAKKEDLSAVSLETARLQQEAVEWSRQLEKEREKSRSLEERLARQRLLNNEMLDKLTKKDDKVVSIEEELAKSLKVVAEMQPSPQRGRYLSMRNEEEVSPMRDNWMREMDEKMSALEEKERDLEVERRVEKAREEER